MDIISILSIVLLVGIEISVLVYLYRNYITTWNANKWKKKQKQKAGWSTCWKNRYWKWTKMVSSTVIERLKQEYMQSQGTLTRVSKSGSPEHGLEVAESILKSMGWKNPNVLLVANLARTLGGLVSTDSEPEKEAPLRLGKDLFGAQ